MRNISLSQLIFVIILFLLLFSDFSKHIKAFFKVFIYNLKNFLKKK